MIFFNNCVILRIVYNFVFCKNLLTYMVKIEENYIIRLK
jgi:hypothetical protein